MGPARRRSPSCKAFDLLGKMRRFMAKRNDIHMLEPDDDIDQNAKLFVVNRSNSNKKLFWNGGSCMLSAPGTEGSIQPLNRELLSNPHFVAMWADGRVGVSDSPSAQRSAISDIAVRNRRRREDSERIRGVVIEDASESDDPNVVSEDVSFKAKRIVDDSADDSKTVSVIGLPEAE